MFVPRALRLKGVREKQRPKTAKAVSKPPANDGGTTQDDALVEAMRNTSTNSPAPQEEVSEPKATSKGPRFTTKPVTPDYIAQLAAGIELIFTDYAHHDNRRAKWLWEHYRAVDGEENFIHLTAILEHRNISSLKPEASQILLQQALRDHPSDILEVSSSGYYVRRKPASYPPKFLPQNSFEVVNDDGLTFWDQRTIYVEPHMRSFCQTPAKVAHWLKEHGQLKQKWLPIQAIYMLWNSCAFVVLSGSVMHDNIWQKWREANKPDNWKVMTKVEHTKRTAEYMALLEQQNPGGMLKSRFNDNELPAIARPAVLAMDTTIVPNYTEPERSKGKRKRKNKKSNTNHAREDDNAEASNNAVEEAADHEPSRKRQA